MQQTGVSATDRQRNTNNQAQNIGNVERWASLIGGGLLAAYAMRSGRGGVVPAVLGAGLIARGVSGHCYVYQALGINAVEGQSGQTIQVDHTITIDRSPAEVFQFWRNFANLPRFMNHLESVAVLDNTHSHWEAKGPVGSHIAWDAEIILEKENELIAWKSLTADVANAGSVRFQPVAGGQSCDVHVRLAYKPPAGALGAAVARLLGEEPGQQIEGDMRRLKQVLETGTVLAT